MSNGYVPGRKQDLRTAPYACHSNRMRLLWGVCLSALSLYGQLTAAQKQLNIASFEKVWTTVRDKHWERNPGGLDWQAIHEEIRPKIEKAEKMDEAPAACGTLAARAEPT